MKVKFNYEESVEWLRNQPEYAELVRQCYLDRDNLEAAKRFTLSEEFVATKKLLKLSDKTKQLRVLDLGCGNGIASYAFATLGHAVTAVDPDSSQDVGLEATRRLSSKVLKGSISTVQSFAESLPFEDETFDLIYARQALHHFLDLDKALHECSRVLKAKGLFLAVREHVVSNESQRDKFLENHVLHRFHGGENAYPVSTYVDAIKRSGFHRIKILAPYDTVINHFPVSNKEVKEWLSNHLHSKPLSFLANIFSESFLIERLYRKHLSKHCNTPGRLYSFSCVK